MKKLLLASAVLSCAVASQAVVVFEDGFESGNLSKWTVVGTNLGSIVTDPVKSGTYAAKITPGTANSNGLYANVTPITGSDPVIFEFDLKLDSLNAGNRHFASIRSYSGDAYGSGSLEQVYAIGAYNAAANKIDANGTVTSSTADTTRWYARVALPSSLYANGGWFILDQAAVRSTNWTHFKIEIMPTTIQFYVDGVAGLATPLSRGNSGTIDSIAFSSFLTSAGVNAYYDNFSLTKQAVPEPMTLIGLGTGLGALVLRRKRNK